MGRQNLKSRILYGFFYMLFSIVVIFGLSQFLSYFNKGASDPIYNIDSILFEEAPSKLKWQIDDEDIKGPINKYIRKDIEKAYAKAWQVKNLSISSKKDLGLKEHYSEPLQNLIKKGYQSESSETEIISLSHNLKLHFISFDKQIVSFTDYASIRHFSIIKDNRKYAYKDTSDFKVVMTLDDGKWRIKRIHNKNESVEKPTDS